MTHLVGEAGRLDQRLAWYTAVVEAIAAHLVRFDQRHLSLNGGTDICGN